MTLCRSMSQKEQIKRQHEQSNVVWAIYGLGMGCCNGESGHGGVCYLYIKFFHILRARGWMAALPLTVLVIALRVFVMKS